MNLRKRQLAWIILKSNLTFKKCLKIRISFFLKHCLNSRRVDKSFCFHENGSSDITKICSLRTASRDKAFKADRVDSQSHDLPLRGLNKFWRCVGCNLFAVKGCGATVRRSRNERRSRVTNEQMNERTNGRLLRTRWFAKFICRKFAR